MVVVAEDDDEDVAAVGVVNAAAPASLGGEMWHRVI